MEDEETMKNKKLILLFSAILILAAAGSIYYFTGNTRDVAQQENLGTGELNTADKTEAEYGTQPDSIVSGEELEGIVDNGAESVEENTDSESLPVEKPAETKPVEQTKPTEPTKPVEKPVEKPVQPKPTEPAKPTQPTQPTQPSEPKQPDNPPPNSTGNPGNPFEGRFIPATDDDIVGKDDGSFK